MYAAADMAFVAPRWSRSAVTTCWNPRHAAYPSCSAPIPRTSGRARRLCFGPGAAWSVHDGDELARVWLELLEDPDKREQIGAAARQAVGMRAKTVDRTLDLLDRRVLDLVDRWILDPERLGAGPLDPFRKALRSSPGSSTRTDRGPAIRFVRCALLPPSLLFGFLVRFRNWMYDSGLLNSERLPAPVISVGALTVGGAGKTPVVRYLAGRLRDAGYRPAVLSRGYGRKTGAMRRATPGASWQEVGDEPASLASMLPDVPVVVGPSRTAAGRLAIERYGANVLLLDDGFQHRRTDRVVNIVVHDATVRSNPGRLLPAGPYREPLSSLQRAHALVLTRTDQARPTEFDSARLQTRSAAVDSARIKGEFPHLPVIETVYDSAGLRRLADDTDLPPDWLSGREVLVLCGIANPASFVQTVTDAGGHVRGVLAYRDHHPFTSSDLDRAMSLAEATGVEWIVTTEKDAVRIPDHAVRKHLVAVDIALRLTSGESALGEILSTLDDTR